MSFRPFHSQRECGRPSLTRFSHSRLTGRSGIGMPKSIAPRCEDLATLQASRK